MRFQRTTGYTSIHAGEDVTPRGWCVRWRTEWALEHSDLLHVCVLPTVLHRCVRRCRVVYIPKTDMLGNEDLEHEMLNQMHEVSLINRSIGCSDSRLCVSHYLEPRPNLLEFSLRHDRPLRFASASVSHYRKILVSCFRRGIHWLWISEACITVEVSTAMRSVLFSMGVEWTLGIRPDSPTVLKLNLDNS